MQKSEFDVKFYDLSDGSKPAKDFVLGLPILTHGFVKKTQKTPPSEIDRAKKYRDEYLSRKENQQ